MLRRATQNLARLRIVKDAPHIEVVNNPQNPESEYKDVYIYVEEDETALASLKYGLNAKGDWVFHLVLEERNLDPFRFPNSSEDYAEGRAFRGAGWAVGVDFQLTVPLTPVCKPFVTCGGKWRAFVP